MLHAWIKPGGSAVFTLLCVSLLAGHTSVAMASGGANGKIRIDSDPNGAMVYADGNEIGTTPVEIAPGDSFRSGFVGFTYRYFGKLTIKKPGCENWSVEVNDYILSRDVHATLKCDPNYQPVVMQPASSSLPAGTGSSDSANLVERLERIELLHQKKLITDEEYKQLREKILKQL